jgi:hypothetical protein
MWNRIAPLIAFVAAAGCVPSAAQPAPAAEPTPPPPKEPACAFLERVPPIDPGPGVPRVAAPAAVIVTEVRADLKLSADGKIALKFDVDLSNPDGAAAEALVGYAFRTPGDRIAAPLADRVAFGDGLETRSCGAKSAPALHAVYTDEAAYAVVSIPGGGEAHASGEVSFEARRFDSPMTLFGYEDAAALNLKRFPWSYLQDAAYRASADSARPYFSAIDLVPAQKVRVIVSAQDHGNWIRAMSHEQNGAVLRSPGTFGWSFMEADAPAKVAFEFNPALGIADEIRLFEALAAARPKDLRAMIRLTDLQRFGGDKRERADVLEKLLAAYEANAQEQLLAGGNDVRAAAYVALVKSLDLAGDRPAAKAKAREGIAAMEKLDAPAKTNRAALAWLKKYVEKP